MHFKISFISFILNTNKNMWKRLNFFLYQFVYMCIYFPYHLYELCFHGKLLFAGMAMATLPIENSIKLKKSCLFIELILKWWKKKPSIRWWDKIARSRRGKDDTRRQRRWVVRGNSKTWNKFCIHNPNTKSGTKIQTWSNSCSSSFFFIFLTVFKH